MRLYLLNGCPFAHRATIVLQEKKLEFEPIFFAPPKRPAELDSIGPYAKSPTLVDGDTKVWDSAVVLEYLEDRYPNPSLMPKDAAARAEVRMLEARVGPELAAKQGVIVMEMIHKGPETRDEAKVEEAKRGFFEALIFWDERLAKREFLVGGALSLADITLFTILAGMHRFARVDMPAEQKHLRAFYERMSARPTTKLLESTQSVSG